METQKNERIGTKIKINNKIYMFIDDNYDCCIGCAFNMNGNGTCTSCSIDSSEYNYVNCQDAILKEIEITKGKKIKLNIK